MYHFRLLIPEPALIYPNHFLLWTLSFLILNKFPCHCCRQHDEMQTNARPLTYFLNDKHLRIRRRFLKKMLKIRVLTDVNTTLIWKGKWSSEVNHLNAASNPDEYRIGVNGVYYISSWQRDCSRKVVRRILRMTVISYAESTSWGYWAEDSRYLQKPLRVDQITSTPWTSGVSDLCGLEIPLKTLRRSWMWFKFVTYFKILFN